MPRSRSRRSPAKARPVSSPHSQTVTVAVTNATRNMTKVLPRVNGGAASSSAAARPPLHQRIRIRLVGPVARQSLPLILVSTKAVETNRSLKASTVGNINVMPSSSQVSDTAISHGDASTSVRRASLHAQIVVKNSASRILQSVKNDVRHIHTTLPRLNVSAVGKSIRRSKQLARRSP